MDRTSPEDAILECKKGGGYLAPMDSSFTPHLIHVMGDLFREKKLEVQHKLWVGIRWIPERKNWIRLHDDSVVSENMANCWKLPKTASEHFCTCVWLGANNAWTVGTFMCGPEHRAICRYDKGRCSNIKCPGNALFPVDSGNGMNEHKFCSPQECEDSCHGYVSTNMSCAGYSYSDVSSQCILQLTRIQPIWNSSYLQVVPYWEATIVNCLEVIYVATVKPLNEYLVYPLEKANLCKTPPVEQQQRAALSAITGATASTGEENYSQNSQNSNPSSHDQGPDWISTESSAMEDSTTEQMVSSQATAVTSLVYAPSTGTTDGVVGKTTTTHIVDFTTAEYRPISSETSGIISKTTASRVTYTNETKTNVSQPNDNTCLCVCGKGDNFTEEEKQAWITELVGNLTIDVKKTGLYTRRHISIDDPRPSAQGYGYVAISFLSTILGILVCMDTVAMCARFNARCRAF